MDLRWPRACLALLLWFSLIAVVHGSEVLVHDDNLIEKSLDGDQRAGQEDRSLYERAPDISALDGNNEPANLNINAGQTQFWTMPSRLIFGPYAPLTPGLPGGENDDGTFGDEKRSPTERMQMDADDEEVSEFLATERQNTPRTVFISINTCLQPGWTETSPQTAGPGQLTLYVSTSSSNQQPSPNAPGAEQVAVPLIEGFANYSMDVTSDLYLGVSAPALGRGFKGGWNYEIAVSIDDYFHSVNLDEQLLFLVDTDTTSALLVTDNLTQADPGSDVYQDWMSLKPPFIVFAQNTAQANILGVQNSFCGLQNAPKIIMASSQDPEGDQTDVQMGMITRGLGNKPKQQFYIRNLNGSSTYQTFLAIQGNSTASGPGVVGGGGQVWQPTMFTTKSDGNCALLFNLSFCSEVAYAVPSNPNTFPSVEAMASLYDDYAEKLYQNFSYSLQLIPCNTTDTAQYSLAKNCTDCAAAYKQWLCAVTMPRCEDFTSELPWLQPRNVGQAFFQNQTMLSDSFLQQQYLAMPAAPPGSSAFKQSYISSFATNSSRNPTIIDEVIMPGPYKEIKPCEDLCYSLVQSCPAALGFGCPARGRGLEVGYGQRNSNGANLTCSYLGAVFYLNAGTSVMPSVWIIGLILLFSGWALA